MEIVGRVTANAVVNQTKGGSKVVNFSIAINDRYKPKDGEAKEFTTYFNCSYWINPGIVSYLMKGALVELSGRVNINAWTNAEGDPKANLNFHVNTIKLHGKGKSTEPVALSAGQASAATIAEPIEDLPF